jgi:hypothetical protein
MSAADLLDYIALKLTTGGFALDQTDNKLVAWVRGGAPEEGRLVIGVQKGECRVLENSGHFSGSRKREFLQQQVDRWCAERKLGAAG